MDRSRNSLIKFARKPFYFTALEKALRRLTFNSSPESLIARLPPKHIDYPSPSVRKTEISGIKFVLDISDLVGWYVYWGFRDAPRRNLYSLIRQGDTVIDVGANLGEVALNAARLVGAMGHVYAFEPFPANFSKLVANCDLNGFENLSIFNKGLGNEAVQVTMITEEKNAGMNRISPVGTGRPSGTTVNLLKLDDFVNDYRLDRIDLIKIDVEGYEMNVLEGAIESLARFRPKIFTEVIDSFLKQQGSSARDLIRFLCDRDYALTHAASRQRIDAQNIPPDFQFDLVAIPV